MQSFQICAIPESCFQKFQAFRCKDNGGKPRRKVFYTVALISKSKKTSGSKITYTVANLNMEVSMI